MRLAALIAAGLLLSAVSFAQDTPDPRWTPWVGCWSVETDVTREGPSQARGRVCVSVRGSEATITTTPDGAAPMTQRIIVDDIARPVADGACTGTEQSAWSVDGFRMYSRAALTCAGAPRAVSGLSMLAPDGTWIEAQSIEIGDRSSVRVRRFVKDGGAPATPARGRLTIAQVQEASRHVAGPALEAALVEARATFGLTRASLLALDDAGVPSSVIDVMVALTYPQAFAIHPASRADRLTAFPFEADPLDVGSWWAGGPAAVGSYFGSAYFFAPFGYSAFGAYPVVFGSAGDGGGGRPRPVSGGRVVNGLGYTRLAPRGADDAGSAGGSAGDGTASSRGRVSSRGYTRSDGGSSSTGSAAGAGSSGGGASGSGGGGRTAVDR